MVELTLDRPNVSDGDRDVALSNEIVRTLCGSDVHGMAIPGHDDRDEMGVYIETPEQLLGLKPSAEHYVSRTQPHGVRSGPGDVDLTLYSLRKFLRLATKGNPTVLTVLYSADEHLLTTTPIGTRLRRLRRRIVSARAGWRYLGYLDGQRERMVGRGRQSRVPNRPELVEAHGYDTKYASHALRLGLQGIQLMTTGSLTLPLRSEDREACMEIKRGEVNFEAALKAVDDARARLADVMENKRYAWAEQPDMQAVNAWMVKATKEHWAT